MDEQPTWKLTLIHMGTGASPLLACWFVMMAFLWVLYLLGPTPAVPPSNGLKFRGPRTTNNEQLQEVPPPLFPWSGSSYCLRYVGVIRLLLHVLQLLPIKFTMNHQQESDWKSKTYALVMVIGSAWLLNLQLNTYDVLIVYIFECEVVQKN